MVEIRILLPQIRINRGFFPSRTHSEWWQWVEWSGVEGGGGGSDPLLLFGYTIDQEGNVEVPKLGKSRIGGLTEKKLKVTVEKELIFFSAGEVSFKLPDGWKIQRYKNELWGSLTRWEVKIIFKKSRHHFWCAGSSGELAIGKKKTKLFIIRQYEGGSKIHQINLKWPSVWLAKSPFYFNCSQTISYNNGNQWNQASVQQII